MYSFIRFFGFLISPERSHDLCLALFHKLCVYMPWVRSFLRKKYDVEHEVLSSTILGLTFKNPVGLAAGLDKNAVYTDSLSCFGFGFIEVGTLTPYPQVGNLKPRLFRVPKDKALINRMGFNNRGVTGAIEFLKKRKSSVLIGGNISKNKATPNENAHTDYTLCIEALYAYVDYFVVNVSSPNTPHLRELQNKSSLKKLLSHVRVVVNSKEQKKPVLLKIAPDLTIQQLDDIIDVMRETKMDGVIATNTTISREGLHISNEALSKIGPGGMSGKPLKDQSTVVIRHLRSKLGPLFPIIGSGGIMNAQDAIEKIEAGANLIQIYTGLIYQGPSLIRDINQSIIKYYSQRQKP